MARITAGVATSHVPAIGAALDNGKAGERILSTTNRNFENRQGRGARTHLVGPALAAAAAVSGRIVDVRKLTDGQA